ncbi:MAG: DUF1425 domain-containing protein [Planctomycetes bacterium]|nr:DUF1425 domain-containing protein [Planctomycetota bacterium]
MKTITNILFFILVMLVIGCHEQHDPRIHLREEIGSDTPGTNIVTRIVSHAFSALIGEGIEITEAITQRNDTGFLEVHINGYNRSYQTRRFRYKVEWLDKNILLIQSRTSVWLPASAMGKSPFSLKAVASRPEAENFRMDTKKWE